LKGIFTQTNEKYIMDLENNGKTDTVFWIGHVL
jgi:hypothetical protein